MSSMSEVVAKIPFDRKLLPQDFHMPGIEPWIAVIIRQHKPSLVLDLGVGMGFWGFLIKSYIARDLNEEPILIGVDIDIKKLMQLKKMNIYDELICSDIRYLPFKVKAFNMVIAIESLYMKEFWNVIRDIETLIDNNGLIILSRGFKEEIRKRLLSEGYDVYRVYLRGLMLTRLNDGEKFLRN